MLQPKKFTPKQKKAAKTVDKVVKASVIAKLLNNIPGAETVYDISNVLKSVSEGDPIKIGSNTVGALLPGVSGKAFEAVTEDYLPPVSKKQINKNKKVLQGKRATSEEIKKVQSNSGFSEGMDVLKKDVTNFFSDLLAYGTSNQGIMKKKMNSVKRYANGTDAKGMDPNHYIISPAEALNDYNIMLAKAEAEANSNPWLPIVAIAGQALQTGIGIAGQASMKKATNRANAKEDINASNDSGIVAAMGNNNVQKDVEVEGGEMFETPQSQVGEFKGPSHEQGGIPLEVGKDVEKGTKVYSDRLKVGEKTLAERKATRERQIANLEKIASNNLADEAVKNAAKRKMQAIQKEEAADLQFQDQVNNIQAMADTMVQTFAYGTGKEGVQKMGNGGIVYGKGYDESMFKDFFTKYNELNPGAVMDMKYIQGDLGIDSKTKGFGEVFGPTTFKATQDWLIANKNKKPDAYVNGDLNEDGIQDTLANNPSINFDALKNFGPPQGINDNASLSYGDPYAKDGVNFEMPTETIMTPVTAYQQEVGTEETPATKKEPSKLAKALEGNMPAVGDITKLIGNYLGMTAGIKTAAEQRSTDVTHRNVFANAGEESQRLLDNAKQGIETSKAQAIVKATTVGRGGKKGARGSARGVNTMRATDWLYDTALQEQIAQISANAAQQIAGIDTQKSSVAMNADQLKGQGEYQAAMANEAAKDAYYTALGLGRKDFATGMQQTGKDLNDMKENKIIEGLMKNYGTYFVGDRSGVKAKTYEEITGGKDKKGSTASEKLEVKIDTEGNEYIIVSGKKQLIKRK